MRWNPFALFASRSAPTEKPGSVVGAAKTGAQVPASGRIWGVAGEVLFNPLPASYKTYREIRRQPTVALARALTIAPVVAATWSVEADDDVPEDAIALIESELLSIREPLVEAAMKNCTDFGWSAFEKVFRIRPDGRVGIHKIKSLVPDITTIMVDDRTGAFAGFRQAVGPDRMAMILPLPYSLLINLDLEGTQWYGNSRLENLRDTYNAWAAAEKAAAKYDEKVAGARWAVHYPPGSTETEIGGELEPNSEIALRILNRLQTGGSVMMPRRLEDLPTDTLGPARDSWSIDFLADPSPRQGEFVTRQKYMDTLLVRGLLMPERAVLEGQFGTKAEAGVHGDLAMIQRDLEHRTVTRHVQWHVVDQLVAVNFGESMRGKVRIKANPLVDEKAVFFRDLYKALIGNPSAALELISRIDFDSLSQSVGINPLETPNDMTPDGPDPADPGIEDGKRLFAAARAGK